MRCLSVVLALSFITAAQGVFSDSNSESLRFIVKYKSNALSISSLKSQLTQLTQLQVHELNPMANGAYSVVFSVPKNSIVRKELINSSVLTALQHHSQIRYAVVDKVGYFKPIPEPQVEEQLANLLTHESQWDEFSAPAGVMLESQPGLRDGAWAYTTGKGKNPVVVAVLDTGIALNPSLINNLVKDKQGMIWGWNFAANNSNLIDETRSYHGTHVAGTIAGYGNVMNGIGEDLKILPIKIPAKNGMFYESSVINAIYWSVGASVPGVPNNIHPAKVLNMSFGVDLEPGREVDYCDEALQEAVFFARQKGAVLAVAAGNDNHYEHFNAPAVCDGTLKIASTGPEALRSYFSNYGPSASFAAPGGDKRYGLAGAILSTVNPGGGYQNSGFDFYQGTSMATPHVAGVAGLVYAASTKELSSAQVENILYTTTHDFGKSSDENKSCVGKKACGHGILDAQQAIQTVLAQYDVLFSAPQISSFTIEGCAAGTVSSKEETLTANGSKWNKIQEGCELEARYQHPNITKEHDGVFYAHYGVVRYKLDTSSFKACELIGYDGIGCWY